MGLQITQTPAGPGGMEVFQSKNLEDVPGGVTLDADNNWETDQNCQKGELVKYDEATRLALVAKLCVVETTTAGTAIKVEKGHCFAVGDFISTGADGGEAYDITAINQSNAAYDTLTVSTAIGSLTAGDTLWLSTGTGGATAGVALVPNGVLKFDVKPSANDAISVVTRGTVYERRLPGIYGLPNSCAGVPSQHKTGLTDRILFSQSF
jgi:hypothetical protein